MSTHDFLVNNAGIILIISILAVAYLRGKNRKAKP